MNIERLIKDRTKYKREASVGEKILSASDIGNDSWMVALKIKYGVIEKDIDQTTIGTLLHLGLETIFTPPERKERKFNDWTITGLADYIDEKESTVYDFKLTKSYTGKKIKERLNSHHYTVQLNVYRWLYEVRNMKLVMFYKDGGYDYKKDRDIPQFEIIDIPIIDIEAIINGKIKMVERYMKEELGRCEELYERGDKPIRCIKYCSVNEFCPYYKKYIALRS